MLTRIIAAFAAFRTAQARPAFAVIYDVCEGDPAAGAVVSEEYYERFSSPAEAARVYRAAFPDRLVNPDALNNGNARLVLILGEIDEYAR